MWVAIGEKPRYRRRMSDKPTSALLLFSGGQDSATCLAWALARYELVETVGFDYGQRHTIEMQCRDRVRINISKLNPDWAARLGDDHIVDLSVLGEISDTALTRDVEISMDEAGLPSTFVPGRNLIFLNFAAALGYRRGITHLIGGMCEADFSGYPDCRAETLDATMHAISLGMDRTFTLETPLMHVSKAGAWDLAENLGGLGLVDVIVEDTHTCYLGDRGARHDWGYGCGTCPACDLRAKGWAHYKSGQFNR